MSSTCFQTYFLGIDLLSASLPQCLLCSEHPKVSYRKLWCPVSLPSVSALSFLRRGINLLHPPGFYKEDDLWGRSKSCVCLSSFYSPFLDCEWLLGIGSCDHRRKTGIAGSLICLVDPILWSHMSISSSSGWWFSSRGVPKIYGGQWLAHFHFLKCHI